MRARRLVLIVSALVLVAGGFLLRSQLGDDPAGATPSPTPKLKIGADEVTVETPRGTYVARHVRPSARYQKPELLGADQLVLGNEVTGTGAPVVVFATDANQHITDVMVGGVTTESRRGPSTWWLASKDGVELAWDAQGFSDWTIERNGNLVTKAGDGHHLDPVQATTATRYTISRAGDPTAYAARLPVYDDSLIGKDVTAVGELTSPGGATVPGATVHASRETACDDVLANPSAPVSERTADADRQQLTDVLMGRDGIRSVGMSSCGSQPVVVVGTKNLSAQVPAQGLGGTPVIAYKQRPIYAF
jgi:hypothetical protein